MAQKSAPKQAPKTVPKKRGISYDEMAAIALRAVSMKTMVEPEEIAALVVYLTGPSGRPISGQVMQICGGLEYTE